MVGPTRETFTTRFGALMTMIGVAVGLGNVWRFPYMVGRYGGAGFVVIYIVAVIAVGVPALVAEWSIGRHTRLGTAGAYARAGLPFGRQIGWFLFFVVGAATAYYTNAVGWVLYQAVRELVAFGGIELRPSAVLPPDSGFDKTSFAVQLACTGAVVLSCTAVLIKGLRSGIERASRWIMPGLGVVVVLLVVRTLTLPGSWEGVQYYLLKFEPSEITGGVVVAALGQACFSLALGGTFMVVYGSYLGRDQSLATGAGLTAAGDLAAGLLAGLAIVPAVIALGFEPSSGPGLIFSTLPEVFARMPAGGLVGLMFFVGLFGAAYLSDVAAFEVLVAGVTDNTRLTRKSAVWLVAGGVSLLAIPPMINMRIFIPWDLTFGSGMQTLGALVAVVTFGWFLPRRVAFDEIGNGIPRIAALALYYWLRFVVPGAILLVGVWWFWSEVL